ncbi:uncharacterized protein EKO05_0002749 [Ascochyta rabiei]|uniref:uncharacterized protein n=1 Tax=Didymella rabiei TaxID=5454 RepID=UPI00220CE658|nr:uncharacterized protein EKO05_0002749 [Ascochyta rabiei]UPX12185.1 hypothetical protein EKO05_0002749 [Ascochyta rabiei]
MSMHGVYLAALQRCGVGTAKRAWMSPCQGISPLSWSARWNGTKPCGSRERLRDRMALRVTSVALYALLNVSLTPHKHSSNATYSQILAVLGTTPSVGRLMSLQRHAVHRMSRSSNLVDISAQTHVPVSVGYWQFACTRSFRCEDAYHPSEVSIWNLAVVVTPPRFVRLMNINFRPGLMCRSEVDTALLIGYRVTRSVVPTRSSARQFHVRHSERLLLLRMALELSPKLACRCATVSRYSRVNPRDELSCADVPRLPRGASLACPLLLLRVPSRSRRCCAT